MNAPPRILFSIFKAAMLCSSLASPFVVVCKAADEIVRGSDEFEFVYRAKFPQIAEAGQLWLPLAQTNPWQTVEISRSGLPVGARTVRDSKNENEILVLPVNPGFSGKTIEITYRAVRKEKGPYAATEKDPSRYLQPERLVPANETFNTIANEVVRGKGGALERGRALYDHVATRLKYDKSGSGWGRGDALYACDVRAGNCTDFHAYFIALARAAGIPARFAIGVTIPADSDQGAIAGYHCWAEFLADGKWVPVDISEAAKNPKLADYYFGHHPANRLELSMGRDLEIESGPASGPINFLIYPLLEVGGRSVKAETEFAFRRLGKK